MTVTAISLGILVLIVYCSASSTFSINKADTVFTKHRFTKSFVTLIIGIKLQNVHCQWDNRSFYRIRAMRIHHCKVSGILDRLGINS